MTPTNAIDILDNIASSVPMKRQDHMAAQQAVSILRGLINPPPEKIGDKKPPLGVHKRKVGK